MKYNNTITTTALTVGLVAGVVTTIAVILTSSVWWYGVLCGAVAFLLSFLFAHFVVRRFVVHKLRPIYQRIFSVEVKDSELERKLPKADGLVDGIESEISLWAEGNKREIERLKEREKYRKEYVGNVSHEIKTPIFNIQGYISTLLDGGLEDPSINRLYLERTEKSIDRLINLVQDLEQISKFEASVLKLAPERFDIVEVVRESIETVDIEASRRNIKISIMGSSPIYVIADRHYISQLLINLLTNSIKYGREDGRTRISFVDLFDKVMVEVSDSGVGIAKEDIPRVFERFYRTDKSRSRAQGGTGLGLSIVKHIIEAHNETITLRSELNKGSTFSFTLTKHQPVS